MRSSPKPANLCWSARTSMRPVFALDIRWRLKNDLLSQKVQKRIRGGVQGGMISAVWMGTPCNSFSRARDRPGGPEAAQIRRVALRPPRLCSARRRKGALRQCPRTFFHFDLPMPREDEPTSSHRESRDEQAFETSVVPGGEGNASLYLDFDRFLPRRYALEKAHDILSHPVPLHQ